MKIYRMKEIGNTETEYLLYLMVNDAFSTF